MTAHYFLQLEAYVEARACRHCTFCTQSVRNPISVYPLPLLKCELKACFQESSSQSHLYLNGEGREEVVHEQKTHFT